MALRRDEGDNLSNEVTNIVNTTNVVEVDYIDADYQNGDD